MRYRGLDDFSHDLPDLTGVLITNLGTPEAPTRRPCGAIWRNFSVTRGWWK